MLIYAHCGMALNRFKSDGGQSVPKWQCFEGLKHSGVGSRCPSLLVERGKSFMNQMQVFKYQQNEIRTIEKNGELWWVLKDVCNVLDLGSPHKVADRLEDDEKGRNLIPTPGGDQEMVCVNESGLYNVILRSDKPQAKPFRRWVTAEVLPSIRKHGAYMTPTKIDEILNDPDTIIQLATILKEERAKNKALEAENEHQRQLIADFEPVKNYVDTILSSVDTMATTQIAADYDLSARHLNSILYEEKVQHNINGQWILYREYMGKGYTKSKTISFIRSDGMQGTRLETRWTQKGRLMIHEILKSRGIVALMDRASGI